MEFKQASCLFGRRNYCECAAVKEKEREREREED